MQLVRSPNEATQRQQLSPALLNAIFLWGACFSSDATLLAQEQAFLSLATQSLATSLLQPPTDNHNLLVQVLQAEVLISAYFFSRGRILEGQYHCGAAVSLALSCGLHQVRSSPPPAGDTASSSITTSMLPVARDRIEENERIDAFWTVYNLEKCWAAALGFQVQLTDAGPLQINTPWPMEGEEAVSDILSSSSPLFSFIRL